MPPAFRLDAVTKIYPRPRGPLDFLRGTSLRPGVRALHEVSFAASSGEVVGLLGPNGAGKSTLIRILAQLVKPTSGEVVIEGIDLRRNPLEARARVGYVAGDERSFFWRLSGLENLRFFAALYGLDRAEAERGIGRYLDLFGLSAVARQRFSSYSSGTRRLFTIIRGLIHEPDIVLMDEPTNSLDPLTRQRLMEFVGGELVLRARAHRALGDPSTGGGSAPVHPRAPDRWR